MTKRTDRLARWPLLFAVMLGCGRSEPATSGQDSTAVSALVQDRLAAARAGDTARWHRQVSEDCLWTGPALRTATTREVLSEIAANRTLRPAAQQIQGLAVYVSGDVAQATYVQLVQDAGQAAEAGKRFRKTDTYQRRGSTWVLIGATEIAVPFRPRQSLPAAVAARLAGRYAAQGLDTLIIALGPENRFVLRGTDGTTDTLVAENDSTLFEEGDPGSWVFSTDPARRVVALRYRMVGSTDVVLPRVPDP